MNTPTSDMGDLSLVKFEETLKDLSLVNNLDWMTIKKTAAHIQAVKNSIMAKVEVVEESQEVIWNKIIDQKDE
jgi:hypothetical protein